MDDHARCIDDRLEARIGQFCEDTLSPVEDIGDRYGLSGGFFFRCLKNGLTPLVNSCPDRFKDQDPGMVFEPLPGPPVFQNIVDRRQLSEQLFHG